jgi:hypothetical protein
LGSGAFHGRLCPQGRPDEFTKLNKILEELWEKLSQLDSNPVLLAVPGNHDLKRPTSKASRPVVELLRDWRDKATVQDEFWKDPKSS